MAFVRANPSAFAIPGRLAPSLVRLGPLLHIECGHAPEARGGHSLPVTVVVDVAGGEDAVRARGRLVPVVRPEGDVAHVELELSLEARTVSSWLHLDWMLLVVGAWLVTGVAGVFALRRFTFVSRVLF